MHISPYNFSVTLCPEPEKKKGKWISPAASDKQRRLGKTLNFPAPIPRAVNLGAFRAASAAERGEARGWGRFRAHESPGARQHLKLPPRVICTTNFCLAPQKCQSALFAAWPFFISWLLGWVFFFFCLKGAAPWPGGGNPALCCSAGAGLFAATQLEPDLGEKNPPRDQGEGQISAPNPHLTPEACPNSLCSNSLEAGRMRLVQGWLGTGRIPAVPRGLWALSGRGQAGFKLFRAVIYPAGEGKGNSPPGRGNVVSWLIQVGGKGCPIPAFLGEAEL